jgi:hypothetical protein
MWRWPFIVSVLLALLSPTASESGPDTGLGFSPINEPNENAFTILVPTGWKSQGGIFRVNAAEMGGPLNALVAKCDLAFTSPDGMVMFHILPDIVYAHVGIGGGFWQPGSVYQGAVVRQLESAEQHLMSLFNYHHSQAGNAQVLKSGPLPWEIEALRRASAYSNQLLAQIGGQTMTSEFDAAAMMVEYTEQGVRYRSVMATGIVNQRAAMTWNNTRTLEFRAPAAEFDRWRPVMDVMRYSVRFNLPWVLKETNNQREQADFIMKVFQESNRIDQEMLAKSRVNREEIMNDNFLVLTGQEEFVNPHTGETEVDTDAYRYRWKTDGGDVYYTNQEDVDPNTFLQRTDYQRSPVRKRRNE